MEEIARRDELDLLELDTSWSGMSLPSSASSFGEAGPPIRREPPPSPPLHVHIKNYVPTERCWSCGDVGHRRDACTRRSRIFCSRCGLLTVMSRDCPCATAASSSCNLCAAAALDAATAESAPVSQGRTRAPRRRRTRLAAASQTIQQALDALRCEVPDVRSTVSRLREAIRTLEGPIIRRGTSPRRTPPVPVLPPLMSLVMESPVNCQCWRCGEFGHLRTQCRNPGLLFCSRCQRQGRLSRDCPCPGGRPPY